MSGRFVRSAAALGAAVLLLGACSGGEECPGDASCLAPRGVVVSPSTDEWRRIADAPGPARQEVAAAIATFSAGNRVVYVVGGLLGGGATNAVDVYEPSTNVWESIRPLRIKVHHAMAATLGGKLVVMGGLLEDGSASDRVFVLEDGEVWREAASLKRPRGAGAAVSVGDRIVVVGGVAGGRHVEPVEIFDGTAWRDGATMPSPLDHVSAATDGAFVYVAGGRRGGEHFATFQRYDPASDRWVALEDMPTARSGTGAAFTSGKIVVAGGEGPRMFPEVEAYDITGESWSRLPDLAVPVHGVGVVALGSNVYAFVGGTKVGLAPTRACQVLALP